MPIRRNNLDWARDFARVYRRALRAADPAKCDELDDLARKHRQLWLTPTEVPAAAVEQSLDSVLAPKLIEQFWGIPAATLYAWKSKGLLTDRGEPGAPQFLLRDVLDVHGRNRKTA